MRASQIDWCAADIIFQAHFEHDVTCDTRNDRTHDDTQALIKHSGVASERQATNE